MAQDLTEKEFDEIKNRFSELDKDGNGTLTRAELVEALQAKNENRPDTDIDYMMKILDKDGSGTIGFNEFQEFMALFVYNIELSEIKIIEMFKAFESGGDAGSISYDDAKYLWSMITTLKTTFMFEEFKGKRGKRLSNQEKRVSMMDRVKKLDKILPLFDTNNDGKIDAEEFVKIMTPF